MKLEKLFEKLPGIITYCVGESLTHENINHGSMKDASHITKKHTKLIEKYIRSAINEVIEDVVGEEKDSGEPLLLGVCNTGWNTHRSECIKRAKEWGYEEK